MNTTASILITIILWYSLGLLNIYINGILDKLEGSRSCEDIVFLPILISPLLFIIVITILLHKALYEAGRDK